MKSRLKWVEDVLFSLGQNMETEFNEENEIDKDELVRSLTSFLTERSAYYTRDSSDTSLARSYSSGFAFSEEDREYRGEVKPEVYYYELERSACSYV